MLAGHDPVLDPRVDWEASSAAASFDVLVLGLTSSRNPAPGDESRGGYLMRRVDPRSLAGLPQFALETLRSLDPLRAAAATVLAIASLPLVGIAAGIRALRRSRERIPGWLRRAAQRSGLSGVLGALRRIPQTRLVGLLIHFVTAQNALWREASRLERTPEVVHCNDLDTLLVGYLLARRRGARLVYDAHEFYPHSDVEASSLQVALLSRLERALLREVDAVVTVSPLLARSMQEAYGLWQVLTVPNAEPWRGDRNPVPPMARAGSAEPVRFLYQGNFAPERGIEELIRAWSRIDTRRAVLLLRGPDAPVRDRCLRLAEDLGLRDHGVFFLDPVPEDRLIDAASEADVGVIPYKPFGLNYRYCCPNKLSQYMQGGLAILTNDLDYVRSVVDEARCGLWYRSDEPDSIVAAVNRLVSEPGLLAQLRGRAREFARTRFNWQIVGKTLTDLYAEAAARAARE
jgi:glycosyltransferase involved in cell wall biosynthesis